MAEMVLTFQGTDLVIPRETLVHWGLQPGDSFVIRPIKPQKLDRKTITEILDELRGSWTQQDEEAFYRHREEMWASWKPRTW